MIIIEPYRIYQQLLSHFGKQHWWPAESSFEVIIGAILVQRTTWQNVEKAIRNLKDEGLMNPHSLASANLELIESLIRSVGFYRQKARRILNFSRHLVEQYGGSLDLFFNRPIEEARNELLSLEGIGFETADVILLYAGNKPILPVSAYAMRIFERLGIRKLSIPSKINKAIYHWWQNFFMENLPKDVEVYKEFHALLVKLGKTYCKVNPRCKQCILSDVCNYARSNQTLKKAMNPHLGHL